MVAPLKPFKSQFAVVGILGRIKNPKVQETLKTLMAYLDTLGQPYVLDTETAEAATESAAIPCIPRDELATRCNLLIVIGGDGSLLHAAHCAVKTGIPILGVNRGRLGFLTDIAPHALEEIKAILEGDYVLDKRFLLEVTITQHDTILGQGSALNEVALIPDLIPHMTEFELYIDDQFVCSQDSDGLIIATPTGSTAYALSGGGPILHPALDAMVMVPMFPHTLSMRPLVIEGNRTITIVITDNNATTPRLSCDGQPHIPTPVGSRIIIKKKQAHLHLIHPKDYNYYASLRSKLHWGHKVTSC